MRSRENICDGPNKDVPVKKNNSAVLIQKKQLKDVRARPIDDPGDDTETVLKRGITSIMRKQSASAKAADFAHKKCF